MGFAVHVPHYLARAEYPQAARVLLDHVGLAAGLYLPTESLSTAATRADTEIAEQVAGSEEVSQVVAALERLLDVEKETRDLLRPESKAEYPGEKNAHRERTEVTVSAQVRGRAVALFLK